MILWWDLIVKLLSLWTEWSSKSSLPNWVLASCALQHFMHALGKYVEESNIDSTTVRQIFGRGAFTDPMKNLTLTASLAPSQDSTNTIEVSIVATEYLLTYVNSITRPYSFPSQGHINEVGTFLVAGSWKNWSLNYHQSLQRSSACPWYTASTQRLDGVIILQSKRRGMPSSHRTTGPVSLTCVQSKLMKHVICNLYGAVSLTCVLSKHVICKHYGPLYRTCVISKHILNYLDAHQILITF